ncbi:MAG TPA: choice-of-anchor V domain-containing protein, partial [Candidatus Thermoplasmatota archaeon]
TAWLLSAAAFSSGPPPDTVKNNDGCTCHGGGSPNANTIINAVEGWPSSYVPSQEYVLNISSTTDVPQPALTKNQGGFLAWVSKGTLSTTPETAPWLNVGTMGSGEAWVSHSKQGETENGRQEWTFVWQAPGAGTGPVTLHVYVNRVNGNNGADSGDHWNRKTVTTSEGSASPSSVFPTPSNTVTTNAEPTATDTKKSTTPVDRDQGGQNEPAPGFVMGAMIVLVAAAVVRRRIR